jgi:hypothetical protein
MSTPIHVDPGPPTCNLQEMVARLPALLLDDATKHLISKWGASILVPESCCEDYGQQNLQRLTMCAPAVCACVFMHLPSCMFLRVGWG